MAENSTKKKRKKARAALTVAGESPGSVLIDANAPAARLILHSYDEKSYSNTDLTTLEGLKDRITAAPGFFWLEVRGLGSATVFERLKNDFLIHKLILEDITKTAERPKIEENEEVLYAVSRLLTIDKEGCLNNEQLSFLLQSNLLITFKEDYIDLFAPVRERLKGGRGNIRTAGPSYLMYAIMDLVIDNYFLVLNRLADDLDRIEDELLTNPSRRLMHDLQEIKRNLINIRRVAWPERDKLNDILRSDSPLITEQTKFFFKDAYDHCIQTIETVESLKEMAASNLDMYLSIISNRMNEIMKVLTIISSIFIPLTFIAGIYGMNFAKQDPVTGRLLPGNMPELYQPNGYVITMVVMLVIAILQVVYFWRRGWFK